MPSIDFRQRMRKALADVEQIKGLEVDCREECVEEWTATYAIALIDIVEPDDDVRAFFDLDKAVDSVVDVFQKCFGPTFKVVRERGASPITKVKRALHIHRLNFWGLEIEVYEPKVRSKASKRKVVEL